MFLLSRHWLLVVRRGIAAKQKYKSGLNQTGPSSLRYIAEIIVKRQKPNPKDIMNKTNKTSQMIPIILCEKTRAQIDMAMLR